jgi:type IV pilus assembly protein PilM
MGIFSSETGYLGIDIGNDSIKIVELKKEKDNIRLVTYGFSENVNIGKTTWQGSATNTAKIIQKIIKSSGMSSINAVASLPTFSVFSSVLNLSNVTKKDIASAVHWEAKKVIPLPLDEMILDWKVIKDPDDEGNDSDVRVLLTGAPQTLVKKYIDIFKKAQVNLLSLETETFSLVRSLIGHDKSTVLLVEIGASTTDVTIVDKGIPLLNRSIDVAGETITKAIAKNLNVEMGQAEQFKYDMGISSLDSKEEGVPKIISESISPIVNEIKYAINLFKGKNNNKDIEKIILSGGSAFLPNLTIYLSKVLDMKVIIGNPWEAISYPVDLKPLLNEIGPRMSVAIGLAMREVE